MALSDGFVILVVFFFDDLNHLLQAKHLELVFAQWAAHASLVLTLVLSLLALQVLVKFKIQFVVWTVYLLYGERDFSSHPGRIVWVLVAKVQMFRETHLRDCFFLAFISYGVFKRQLFRFKGGA